MSSFNYSLLSILNDLSQNNSEQDQQNENNSEQNQQNENNSEQNQQNENNSEQNQQNENNSEQNSYSLIHNQQNENNSDANSYSLIHNNQQIENNSEDHNSFLSDLNLSSSSRLFMEISSNRCQYINSNNMFCIGTRISNSVFCYRHHYRRSLISSNNRIYGYRRENLNSELSSASNNIVSNITSEIEYKEDDTKLCLLCDNFVEHPFVELKCKHKYHLNCFIIDNSNEDDKIELKEKCTKCNNNILYDQIEHECSICLEKIIDHKILYNLKCNHKFHIHCIQQWKNMNKNTCPLCRKPF